MNGSIFDREFGNDTEFDYGEGGDQEEDDDNDDNDRESGTPTAAVADSPAAVADSPAAVADSPAAVAASASAVAASASAAGTSNRNWSAAEHIKMQMLNAILAHKAMGWMGEDPKWQREVATSGLQRTAKAVVKQRFQFQIFLLLPPLVLWFSVSADRRKKKTTFPHFVEIHKMWKCALCGQLSERFHISLTWCGPAGQPYLLV
jgi:hypothetical protein